MADFTLEELHERLRKLIIDSIDATGVDISSWREKFAIDTKNLKQILQILDFGVMTEGPVQYAKENRPKAKKDFTIAFELYCPKCKLHDFVKVSNTGWQGGKLKESPTLSF